MVDISYCFHIALNQEEDGIESPIIGGFGSRGFLRAGADQNRTYGNQGHDSFHAIHPTRP